MSEFNNFSHLWNDLPKEERSRLMPNMIESHLLHTEQCKLKIISSHKKLMKELNDLQSNLRESLLKYKRG